MELKNKDDIDIIEKIFKGKDTKWWDEFNENIKYLENKPKIN